MNAIRILRVACLASAIRSGNRTWERLKKLASLTSKRYAARLKEADDFWAEFDATGCDL